MAGRALTGDHALGSGVRKSRRGERPSRRMTGVARQVRRIRRNVVRRFAERVPLDISAVMAR